MCNLDLATADFDYVDCLSLNQDKSVSTIITPNVASSITFVWY